MKRKTNRGINFTLNIFDETLQEKVKIDKKNSTFSESVLIWNHIILFSFILYWMDHVINFYFCPLDFLSVSVRNEIQWATGTHFYKGNGPERNFKMWITTGTGPERNFKICNKPVPNRNGISTYGKQPVPDRNGILFYGKQPVLDQNGRNLKQLALILP